VIKLIESTRVRGQIDLGKEKTLEEESPLFYASECAEASVGTEVKAGS
jgi:hypothetical protein